MVKSGVGTKEKFKTLFPPKAMGLGGSHPLRTPDAGSEGRAGRSNHNVVGVPAVRLTLGRLFGMTRVEMKPLQALEPE